MSIKHTYMSMINTYMFIKTHTCIRNIYMSIKNTYRSTGIHICLKIHIRGAYDKFPDFFRIGI